jgi:hypothetical protein
MRIFSDQLPSISAVPAKVKSLPETAKDNANARENASTKRKAGNQPSG